MLPSAYGGVESEEGVEEESGGLREGGLCNAVAKRSERRGWGGENEKVLQGGQIDACKEKKRRTYDPSLEPTEPRTSPSRRRRSCRQRVPVDVGGAKITVGAFN